MEGSTTPQIGRQIKDLRAKLNMSQTRFGMKIGVSGKTISAYETGHCVPPLRVLENISREYNVPLVNQSSTILGEKFAELETLLQEVRTLLNEDTLTF